MRAANGDERCGRDGWRFRPFVHTADYDSTEPLDLEAEMALMAAQLWFSANVARDVHDGGGVGRAHPRAVPRRLLVVRAGPLVEMLAPALPAVQAIRADLGLPPVDAISDVHDRCAHNLVAAPREFEPEMPLPANVTFIGPVLDGPALLPRADRVVLNDGRDPLILVSFSTSDQEQLPVLQRCVDALAGLAARVLVTTGPAIDPAGVRAAANTHVVQFVPHADVLPVAALVVTHAGMGTVMSSLSYGVPLVCLPLGRDQFFNAAMVERLGAGRTLAADVSVDAIAGAARDVLADAGARDGAKRMANVIAGYGGASEAVTELERVALPS